MALLVNDRVQETGTANTTVSFTLTGSVTGFQSFASGIGNANTTYYAATDGSGNWEVGLGTIASGGGPTTVTRTTILSSSNSNTAVTFSGTVNVWCDYPASKAVYEDASGNIVGPGTITSLSGGFTFPDTTNQLTASEIFTGFDGGTASTTVFDLTLDLGASYG